jgi:hypothetical protein
VSAAIHGAAMAAATAFRQREVISDLYERAQGNGLHEYTPFPLDYATPQSNTRGNGL